MMTHPAGVQVSWVTALGSLVEGLTHRKDGRMFFFNASHDLV